MNIEFVNPSSSLRVYYKARNLASDQDVVFNIWDDTGVSLVSNASALGEIGNRGVYYLDITTPSTSAYLLVKSSLVSGEDIASSVYAVGAPSKKAFYIHATYQTGLQLPYEIFDINTVREDTGNYLTEVAGGFYYTDVNEIDSTEELFFKVGYFVYEFDLRNLVVVSGGILAAGGARTFIVAAVEPRVVSGVIVSGLVLPAYHEVGQGGAILEGAALVEHDSIRGGVVVDGSAEVLDQILVRGGAVANGFAIVAIGEVAEGGILTNGSAIAAIGEAIEGGVLTNGSAIVAIGEVAKGGVLTNGSAIIEIGEVAKGGILTNGSAIVAIGEVAKGGILTNGSAEDQHVGNVTSDGGAIANGQLTVFAVYNLLTSGGLLANGNMGGQILSVDGEGGALVSGTHTLGVSEIVIGGILAGGTTEGFLTFFNYLRDRDYLFSIGEIVYIQDPRKDQPSRYHRHVVEGYRLFGDHNLYNIGIGILVDEEFLVSDLNHDVILSDEVVDTTDYVKYIQRQLDLTPVSPDPVGGSVDSEDSEGNECCVPEYADDAVTSGFMKKLEDLRNTTVLPAPSGGIIAISQQDGSNEVETSSYQKKLDALDSIALLPDPTGAYIIVSTETEPVPV